ncbi:hypothetical protein KCP74_17355 [Salmonella enterica subsp. enterica]|nr:hypothetical protein KCP74_17355 [Salmonella enterica subsp. enterica]
MAAAVLAILRNNVSERLLKKLVQSAILNGYWRRCGALRRHSVNGRRALGTTGRCGGRRRDWSPGWKIVRTFKY